MPDKSPEITIRDKEGNICKPTLQSLGKQLQDDQLEKLIRQRIGKMTWIQLAEKLYPFGSPKPQGEHKSSSSRKELGGEGVPPISACCNASVDTYYHCQACGRPCNLSADFKPAQEECKHEYLPRFCKHCGINEYNLMSSEECNESDKLIKIYNKAVANGETNFVPSQEECKCNNPQETSQYDFTCRNCGRWIGKFPQPPARKKIEELEKLPFRPCESWEEWGGIVRLRLITIEHKINEICKHINGGGLCG